jgi:hypothetical protein
LAWLAAVAIGFQQFVHPDQLELFVGRMGTRNDFIGIGP